MVLAGFGRAGELGFVVSVAARSIDRYLGHQAPVRGWSVGRWPCAGATGLPCRRHRLDHRRAYRGLVRPGGARRDRQAGAHGAVRAYWTGFALVWCTA
jgi:hypothetical protein